MPFVPAPQPCWLILIEDEVVGCGACRVRAVRRAELIWQEEIEQGAVHDGPPTVLHADGLCVTVCCSVCGEWWLAGEHPAHAADMADALRGVLAEGWWGDVCPACVSAESIP